MTPVPHTLKMGKLLWATAIHRQLMIALFLSCLSFGAFGQTVIWSDSFENDVPPTQEQCHRWSDFLDQLEGKSFVSVTISGSRDPIGKTLSDPAAVMELANLLTTRTAGTVESEGHTWTVTKCQTSICASGEENDSHSIALSYDGNVSECSCDDTYAIRPQALNRDWGGINVTSSCNAPDQTMMVTFNSGVWITVEGSTTLCEGEDSTVKLTANSTGCNAGQLSYDWSNDATTPFIVVSEPGHYSVTVTDANGCTGTSQVVVVSQSDVSVTAGNDAVYCDEAVPLNAIGMSSIESNTVTNSECIFNAPGAVGGLDDCTFTSTVCLEGNVNIVSSAAYFTSVNYSNPVKLEYHVYYTAYVKPVTFRFKLNNKEIGIHKEENPSGLCDSRAEKKFPQTFTFTDSQFKHFWNEGSVNELRVEIEVNTTAVNGILLAGITADVTTSNESYSWSPAAGLSSTVISSPLASPEETTTYIVSYTDANGCTATDEVKVIVDCSLPPPPPVAVCKELVKEVQEGCSVSVEANAFDGGSTTSSEGALSFSASPAGPYPVGVTNVELTVTDPYGGVSKCTTKITVTDGILPVISGIEDITVQNVEGVCVGIAMLEEPETSDNCAIASISNDHPDGIFPVGTTTVTWTAKDIHGNTQTATQKVIVTNADPIINYVQASASEVGVNIPITLTTNFTDNNVQSATIDWGDLSEPETIDNPEQTFDASHPYSAAGVYDVTIILIDACGSPAFFSYEGITVLDVQVSESGSVEGDGWFDSEAGFYLKNPRASGRAQFHFAAEHQMGSSVPIGSVNFRFKAGKLDFRSSQLERLMIQDDHATISATGKLNGLANYSILISVVDEQWGDDQGLKKPGKGKKEKDQIRVRISNPAGEVIYDTQLDDPDDAIATTHIGGGSIEINQTSDGLSRTLEEGIASYFGSEETSAYPNPFSDLLNIQYNADSGEEVVIQLMDLAGRAISTEVYAVSDDGYYALDIPVNAHKGMYVLVITQGKRVDYLRLVRQ